MIRQTAWPTADSAVDIHTRLLAGDPVASSDLAVAYLDPLAEWVQHANRRADPHLCDEAAGMAIMSLIGNPHSYKPDKSTLDAYLKMSASGDLKNLLARERRHGARRAPLEVVELAPPGRNLGQEDDPATIVERAEDERALDRQWTSFVAPGSFTPQEEAVLALIQQGERGASAYARVLGISHLALDEQRREVKRVKDRLKRRLQRARGKP